jgi:uncharacterized protein (TIRG00374 family)
MIQTTTRRPRISLSFVITIVLAAVLLFLAFRGIDWNEMLTTLQRAHPERLLVASAILTLSFFLRALRWRVLLSAERLIPPITVFWGTSVGYLGNSVLPARAGEIIRSVLIGRKANLSKSYVLATALTERITDAIFLVLIVLITLSTFADVPNWLQSASRAMALLGVGGFAVLLLAPRFEPFIVRLLARLPEKFGAKATGITEHFLSGMRSLQNPGRALAFLGFTLVVWSVDVVMALQVASAFDLPMTATQALLLLAALGLASAAPSTPGYVGIYQFVAVTILTPFGYTQSEALVFILAFQAITYAVVLLWGLIGLWRLGLPLEDEPKLMEDFHATSPVDG